MPSVAIRSSVEAVVAEGLAAVMSLRGSAGKACRGIR